jgi:hypothetical protein
MRKRVLQILAAAAIAAPLAVSAQMHPSPAPPPDVRADQRTWFLAGEPLFFAGNYYYPGGARVHFNRSEMIRSGYYDGIPLYTRTTLEPYSIVFVPLSGGVMQPYERRRSGELAGTAGSTSPSFPIAHPSSTQVAPGSETRGVSMIGAASAFEPSTIQPQPVVTSGAEPAGPATPVGRLSAAKPEGLNGVFVLYDGRRWFSSGPTVAFDAASFVAAGTYRGVTLFVRPGDQSTIYVPVVESAGSRLTPYSLRRSRVR